MAGESNTSGKTTGGSFSRVLEKRHLLKAPRKFFKANDNMTEMKYLDSSLEVPICLTLKSTEILINLVYEKN